MAMKRVLRKAPRDKPLKPAAYNEFARILWSISLIAPASQLEREAWLRRDYEPRLDFWPGTREQFDTWITLFAEGIGKPTLRSVAKLRAFGRTLKWPAVSLSSLLIPERKTAEGILVRGVSNVWEEVVRRLEEDWRVAYQIPPEKWEEIIAGALHKAKFDEVILTPRSGYLGRDVIASTKGVGCVKIIGSVKAYKPGHLVRHDDVRAFLGVLNAEQDASKGIMTTTSDFAPRIRSDKLIKPFLPTRLELVNGEQLQRWLRKLAKK